MNTPQEPIKNTGKTSDELIRDIAEKALGKNIDQITRINNGVTNEVYCFGLQDKEFILRIARGFEYDIFAIEQWAAQTVSRQGVPVPSILAQGSEIDRGELIRYQIQEKLAGEPMDKLLESGSINHERAEKLTEQAGRLLASIHAAPTTGWGKIIKPNCGIYGTLKERLLVFQQDSERLNIALAAFNPLGVPGFEAVWQGLNILEPFAVSSPVLLPYDLTPDHVFIDANGRITGIIDWGAAQSGDPVQDLVRWNYWNDYQFTIDWLASPYGRSLTNSPNFERRTKLARIIDALLLLDTYTYKSPNRAEAEHAALTVRNNLKQVLQK
jgi:aminoglycoside phosphotransferase (APT) family kinase protein